MNILVGKIITDIQLSDDSQAIKFITNQGDIIADCDADCCSYTWIESIYNKNAALNSEVLEADNIDMPDLGDMEGKEVVAYYGFKIKTIKGECVIDFRNDSNGYYGGWLHWPDSQSSFYGGVYGQNNSTHKWKSIQE